MSRTFLGAMGRKHEWPELPSGVDPMSLSYDDVLLPPQPNTEPASRSNVDISVQFGPFSLKTPLMSAPMDTISGEEMIRKLHELGAIGTLPRNNNFGENLAIVERLSRDNVNCIPAIGGSNFEAALTQAKELKERGTQMVLIDIAHGGQIDLLRIHGEIRNKLGLCVMLGNIATYEQAEAYKKAGVEFARVGVGGGGFCTTRLIAATGVPQLSAVFDTVASEIPNVIADGGIKYPGDVAKAIAAGAKAVMVGSMLAGTDEAPGQVVRDFWGRRYKESRGQASFDYMKDNRVTTARHRAPEGISARVPLKGPVTPIVNEITGGLCSALSYTGAWDIDKFQKKAQFVIVSAASQQENKPHIRQQIEAPGRRKESLIKKIKNFLTPA